MKRSVCMACLIMFAVLLVSRDAGARMGDRGTLEGYVQKTIQFADKNLEVAVRNALRIGDGEEFGEADCLKLTKLKARNLGISSIKGIEKCINIEHLDLGKNQIEDISFIFSLKKLKVLYLDLNKIKGFSPIYALTELVDLDLNYTGFDEITILKTLTKLTSLRVAGNKIDDIGVLVDNDGLGEGDYVDLRDNDLSFDDLNDVLALHNRGVKVDNDPLFDIPVVDKNPLDENGPKPDNQAVGIQPFEQPDEDVVTFDCSAPLKMELKDAKVMTTDQMTIEFDYFDGYASTVKFYKYFDYEVFNAKFAPSGGSGIFKYEYLPAATEHWDGPYFGQIEIDDIQSASEVTVKATDIVCKTSISKTVKFEKSCYSNEYEGVTIHIKLDTFGEDADAAAAHILLRLKSKGTVVAETGWLKLDKNGNDVVDDESPKFLIAPTSEADKVCLGDVDAVNVVVFDINIGFPDDHADIYYSEVLVHAPNLPMPYNYWHCEPDQMFETTCAGEESDKADIDGVDYDLNGWSTVNPAKESEWPDEPGKIY